MPTQSKLRARAVRAAAQLGTCHKAQGHTVFVNLCLTHPQLGAGPTLLQATEPAPESLDKVQMS